MRRYYDWTGMIGAAIALGTVAGGCDGKVGDAVGDGTPVGQEALASTLAKGLCLGLATCCQSIGQAVDVASCEAQIQTQFEFPATSATIKYDPTLGGQCAADLRSSMASCYSLDDMPACEAMFAGTVAPGGACSSSRECAQPASGYASCTPSAAGATSVCSANSSNQHGALGQTCSGTCTSGGDGSVGCSGVTIPSGGDGPPAGSASCYTNDGLYCVSATWTCQPLVALGGHCTEYSACVDDAQCDTAAAQCVPKAAIGEPCSFSTDCSPGAYCGANRSCQPKKSDGQTCSSGSAYDECSGYCLSADEASSGTCASGRERFVPTPTLCQNPKLD
jgi:hypothetical protein